MSDDTERVAMGPHEFGFTPPDRIHVALRGEFDAAQVETYLELLFAHADRHGGALYGVYDLSGFTGLDPAARKRLVYVKRPYPFVAMALVGVSFPMRTVAEMLFRAGRVMVPAYFAFRYKFFPTINGVDGWFDELRRKRSW